ncbi:hypothetical protein N0V88_004456 [Collariella sp. IMI 366227]|nr:hypothetical protein N0V88_004456 [Collariella sp. IMI 366227]
MAPTIRPRYGRIQKERFSAYFAPLKSQPYNESTTRGGAGSHHSSIAWNPLGTLVATGSSDKTLRVWNPEKPNVRFSTDLKGHTAGIEKVAFNPVKDAELCSVSSDGVLKIWDVRTKACVSERGELFQISPEKSAVVSSHQLSGETNQMAFCWSGDKVFLPTNDGRIRILSYPKLEPVLHVNHAVKPGESTEFMLKGHTAPCLTVELSPTGRYLATGGADSIIALFDTKDWICQRTVSRMVGPVKSISSGLEVTHTETGDHVHTFKTVGPCEAVAWAPTRYCLAYSDLGVLRIVGIDADRK